MVHGGVVVNLLLQTAQHTFVGLRLRLFERQLPEAKTNY